MMIIKYDKQKGFYSISKFEEKDILKSVGFRWDPVNRTWYTNDEKNVYALSKFASENTIVIDNDAKVELENRVRRKRENVELSASFSASTDIQIPLPSGLSLYPYQKVGVEFIRRNGNVLIADEMGLGKTIELLAYINYNTNINSVIVVCPASLKLNWERETRKWLVRNFNIVVYNGNGSLNTNFDNNTFLIINYEGVRKYLEQLKVKTWDLLVLDESHYIKNPKALRTKSILGYKDKNTGKFVSGLKDFAKQKVLLTGTPVLNRPSELYTQLKVLNHPLTKSYSQFMNSYVIFDQWGSPIAGKNLEELQRVLRETCMIRREKKEVLRELPNKVRQLITLPADILTHDEIKEDEKYIEIVKQFWDSNENRLKLSAEKFPFEEIAKIRHRTALKKLPYVYDIIEDAVESVGKVVVFGHHLDVLDSIYERFKDIAVKATGNESIEERDRAVSKFQNDPNVKIFIGSIITTGLGITLTDSSLAIFVEIEWRPGDLIQAEDRLHRIGQKNSVLIQYVVVDKSIDGFMIEKIFEKMKTIEQITEIENISIKNDNNL
ncbi:MAG: SNF2-related protein [Candidatus Hydrogenedens sp.]